MKVAVIGATGMVGAVMLQVLEERLGAEVDALLPAASERSEGKTVQFKGCKVPVVSVQEALDAKPDIALFSAGGATSLEWAPKFAEAGTIVIDNSSAWRMDPDKLLVVPEINGALLQAEHFSMAGGRSSPVNSMLPTSSHHLPPASGL